MILKHRSFAFRFEVTRFAILFVERAGSTYLITALNAHPRILAVTEKFDALRQDGKDSAAQLAWAHEFFTPPMIGRRRAVGFKTKLVDVLDPDGFARLLQQYRCRVICLRRRNSVKAVISTINARRQWEHSGNWNLLDEANRLASFRVDASEFERLLHERERLDAEVGAYAKSLQLPTVDLYYEDLLCDREGFVADVFAFLGVTPMPVQGLTLKNTKDNLREAVVNFHELRSRYSGTRYESMFDEVLVTG
jgi:LPS sulfotransferase NodH